MKKASGIVCFILGIGCLTAGFLMKDKEPTTTYIDTTETMQLSVVKGKKVYPKTNTAKGLADNLYLPDHPTPAVIKINEAKQAYFEERYQDACDLWRDALNLKPNHPEGIWHDIGLCSEKLHAWDDAIEAYTKSIEVSKERFHRTDANLYDVYYSRAYVLIRKGDLSKAEEEISKLISINKNSTSLYYRLVDKTRELGDLEKTIYYFDKILELEPNSLSAISGKSDDLATLNRKKDAKAFLLNNKAVAENGTRNQKSNFYYSLGIVSLLNDDEDAALAAFKMTLLFNPRHPYAESELCNIYANKGKGEEAIQHCKNGMNIFPHPRLEFRMCKAFAAAGQYDKGLQHCKALTQTVWNDSIGVNTCCAMNKAGLKDINGAMEYIEKERKIIDTETKKHERDPDRFALYIHGIEQDAKDVNKLEDDIKNGKYAQ